MAMLRATVVVFFTIHNCFLPAYSNPLDERFDDRNSPISWERKLDNPFDSRVDNNESFGLDEKVTTNDNDNDDNLILRTYSGLVSDTSKLQRSEETKNEDRLARMYSTFLQRRKRAGYYRGRCCYVDVMCSRGCRRPSIQGRGKRRSLLKNSALQNEINSDSDNSVFKRELFLDNLLKKTGSPTTSTSDLDLLNFIKGSSKVFLHDYDENSLPRLLQNGKYKQLSPTQNELVKVLPIILDELEYITKEQESR